MQVVIGLVGTRLDAASGPHRWAEWRPSVALCQQSDWVPDRVELLHETTHHEIAERVRLDIGNVAPECAVRTHVISVGGDPWDFAHVYGGLHDFARHYHFKPEHEDYFIHITTGTHVAQICLFLLTETRHFPGKLLQTAPPTRRQRDGSTAGSIAIIDLDLSRYDALATRFQTEQVEAHTLLKSGIATKNHAFNTLIERIEQVALNSNEPILFTGPTGAGKSQLAKQVFELKRQRAGLLGDFVEVNCATLRGDATMSALFGHVKGAFTGAVTPRAGLLREADGGLLFLDEIGELGLDEQALLLRALEEKAFHPFGSDRVVTSDFQLIAGTNRDLERQVCEGNFREDLFARLNLWTFELPGLADRREDIAPNIDYELDQFADRCGRRVTFNKEAREAFLKFAKSPEATWQANFRDLNAAVVRLATLAPQGRITLDLVKEEKDRLLQRWSKLNAGSALTENDKELIEELLGQNEAKAMDLFDRAQLAFVIRVCRESRSLAEAGRRLFQASREQRRAVNDTDRVRKYLAKFGLNWASVQEAK